MPIADVTKPTNAPRASRARIRATNHIDPRCAICPGHFVGDIDLPGFDPDDLVCALCWYELSEETWGNA
jgi:hypothetical protein